MAQSPPRHQQYEQWVRTYAAELYRFAYRLTGKRETAEDLVQETFVEAWRSLESQREPDRARAWLFQILRFRYSHHIRDSRHHAATSHSVEILDQQEAAQEPAPLDVMANKEALQLALNGLTPSIKETFLMVFLEGNTCREVAAIQKIPLGTVLSRLDRARQVLRASLKDWRDQDGVLPAMLPETKGGVS
jgi:RNA polymerase sigma-70 factor (ECF subfamily)